MRTGVDQSHLLKIAADSSTLSEIDKALLMQLQADQFLYRARLDDGWYTVPVIARDLEMGAYCINASDTHWLGTKIDSGIVPHTYLSVARPSHGRASDMLEEGRRSWPYSP